VVSFLFLFTWWQFCIVQILSGPKTFLHISSIFFRSLIGNFLSFLLSPTFWLGIFSLCFLPIFWSGIFFLFCFLPLFDWEFSPFAFFRFFDQEFSPYGELGFWLKTCRTVGHDICQGVGLASGSGIKEMSHIISLTHMQQWWLGNFMQNWSCMHPCDTQASSFYGHVTLGFRIHFFLFKSTQCFQNLLLYQFMHSFESILGIQENSQHSPFRSIHIFFKNWLWLVNLFQRKTGSYFFSKACWLFSRKIYF